MKSVTDKPLAVAPLTSYRYKGRYGWIMIGAKDHNDAMSEASRSTTGYKPEPQFLQVWAMQFRYKFEFTGGALAGVTTTIVAHSVEQAESSLNGPLRLLSINSLQDVIGF